MPHGVVASSSAKAIPPLGEGEGEGQHGGEVDESEGESLWPGSVLGLGSMVAGPGLGFGFGFGMHCLC